MNNHYDFIYLSPHLDDAALSCGGQIAKQTTAAKSVLIVTITAGDPPSGAESHYIAELHSRWELEQDAVAARRAEDIAACQILGADWLHWDVPDCIYRFHPQTRAPLYQSDPDIFGDVHAAEAGLVQKLAERLRNLPPAQQIFAPLTLGHHVDHLLTRAAAEAVWGKQLAYYEDYPYAQKEGALEAVIGKEASSWFAEVVALSEADLQQKINAIAAFKSQLSTFWKGREELERQVIGFAQQRGGEKVWRSR
ncbi:MAG: PIG-L family deacetylase [Caldilineaceae bacterium]